MLAGHAGNSFSISWKGTYYYKLYNDNLTPGSIVTSLLKHPEEGHKPPAYPPRSRSLLSDIRYFLLHKPSIQTLIGFASAAERENYSQRIMQRLDINVEQYRILNIHKIGINVPVRYVHEEILRWDHDSLCWPNHIATIGRIDGQLEHIEIFLFGRKKHLLGFKSGWLGLNFIPLFNLDAIEFQHLPDSAEVDNARYLLYRCSGGYPIGIFSIYVRSPIMEEGETAQAQLFFMVGFNFYGNKDWSDNHIINSLWEMIHNRVTANVMNRIKQLCEGQFQEVMDGLQSSPRAV